MTIGPLVLDLNLNFYVQFCTRASNSGYNTSICIYNLFLNHLAFDSMLFAVFQANTKQKDSTLPLASVMIVWVFKFLKHYQMS